MLEYFFDEHLENFELYTLCNWSQFYAESIWEKIGFCKEVAKFNLHETSVTQDLIYRFWRLANKRGYSIQLRMSKLEKTNGNDIEICINTEQGCLLMPCQAKVLKNSGRYETINHKVGQSGIYQIDLLTRYANIVGGIPIYFFYNYCSDINVVQSLQGSLSIPIQHLGCSIVPAKFIKSNYFSPPLNPFLAPTFFDLHSHFAVPFSELFCYSRRFVNEMIKYHGNVHFYPLEDLMGEGLWEDIAPPAAIGRITDSKVKSFEESRNSDEEPSFNPRFRLFIQGI